jgi:hypothetical protein
MYQTVPHKHAELHVNYEENKDLKKKVPQKVTMFWQYWGSNSGPHAC